MLALQLCLHGITRVDGRIRHNCMRESLRESQGKVCTSRELDNARLLIFMMSEVLVLRRNGNGVQTNEKDDRKIERT
jgi:hypothetical protein